MPAAPTEALLLIGHGGPDPDETAEYHRLARLVAERLRIAVHPCFLTGVTPSILDASRALVAAGTTSIVALPLFLTWAGDLLNDIPVALNHARATWPAVAFGLATPVGAAAHLVALLAQRAREALAAAPRTIAPEETALLLVGPGSHEPAANAEVARLARWLWEGRPHGWVEAAHASGAAPDVAAGIERCRRLGARRVVVLPAFPFAGRVVGEIGHQARAAATEHQIEVLVGRHLASHPGLVETVHHRYTEGEILLAPLGGPRLGAAHGHGPPADLPLLPARYRGGAAVSAAPMAAADLLFNADGQVAWDRMWGADDPGSPFCELALAGGPPHRGTLLEPPDPAQVAADPAGQRRVLAELTRGIALTTGLTVVPGGAPGWLGVACADEAMALWLLRAVLVENISVRREGATLLLPAGPAFRLEHEIKNIITALAKTHHYWTEHITQATGQARVRSWRPALG